MQNPEQPNQLSTGKCWLKRFGFLGFMFFFVKGMLWLIVPALIAYFSLA